MKAIQVTLDEALLRELDASDEVRREGRSAVLRKAARDYLKRRRKERIAEQYRRAYAGKPRNPELVGWEDEGVWPES